MKEINSIKTVLGQYEKLMNDKNAIQNTGINPKLKESIYEDLQLQCNELKKELMYLVEKLPNITNSVKNNKVENVVELKSINKVVPQFENVDAELLKKKWKEDISAKVNAIYDRELHYIQSKEVFKELYEYMTNVYGIVWEQDFKEWRREHIGIPKTLEIIFNNSQYKSIFDAILLDKYNATIERDKLSTRELIEPLVSKYLDKSNGGCATLKKVYLHMENSYNINWNKHMKKYYKENGTHITKKSDLLYWNHGLIEAFRMSINDMMAS